MPPDMYGLRGFLTSRAATHILTPEVHPTAFSKPRKSKYPAFEASGSKNHISLSLGDQKPPTLGAWTLSFKVVNKTRSAFLNFGAAFGA